MKLIPLSQGQFATVDDADFEAVNQFKWHARKTKRGRFYAARNTYGGGKQGYQYLHRFLLPGVPEIHHQDGDGLNNQRYNLRPATSRQNSQGVQQKKLGTTTKFRGVCWHKRDSTWMAQIQVDGQKIHLGYFADEVDAAHAYDSAAVFYFGEWASTNFDIGQITIT